MIPGRTLVITAVLLTTSIADARSTEVWGPPPDWSRYKALAEPALLAKLPDPRKWIVEWPNGYMKGGWRHKGRFVGYLTCGILRATRPVPGYHPVTQFVAVIDNDRVQTVDISQRMSNSLVNVMCDSMVSRGVLPPARLMEGAGDSAIATLGLTVRAVPEGAYVVAVTPASAAATAGLTAGMVVTRANGIKLGGMGAAMTAVLRSDVPHVILETATGGRFDLPPRP